jgi:hypothetical protein
VERAAFEFLWTLSSRDRQFKLRTYPTVAMVFILGLGFLASNPHGFREALATLPQTQKHIFLLYICCAMAPNAFPFMRYSDRFEAAWIYRILPLAVPGEVLRAGLKVVLVRLVMPSFIITAAVALAVWGLRIAPDVGLALLATLLTCFVQARLMGSRFPFSEPYGVVENTGRVGRSFLFMLIPAALGLVHWGLTFVPFGLAAAAVVTGTGAWLALRAYGRTPWRAVLAAEA